MQKVVNARPRKCLVDKPSIAHVLETGRCGWKDGRRGHRSGDTDVLLLYANARTMVIVEVGAQLLVACDQCQTCLPRSCGRVRYLLERNRAALPSEQAQP